MVTLRISGWHGRGIWMWTLTRTRGQRSFSVQAGSQEKPEADLYTIRYFMVITLHLSTFIKRVHQRIVCVWNVKGSWEPSSMWCGPELCFCPSGRNSLKQSRSVWDQLGLDQFSFASWGTGGVYPQSPSQHQPELHQALFQLLGLSSATGKVQSDQNTESEFS